MLFFFLIMTRAVQFFLRAVAVPDLPCDDSWPWAQNISVWLSAQNKSDWLLARNKSDWLWAQNISDWPWAQNISAWPCNQNVSEWLWAQNVSVWLEAQNISAPPSHTGQSQNYFCFAMHMIYMGRATRTQVTDTPTQKQTKNHIKITILT
jgi:hypothetical protein